jgi:zinc D-Ala-D-Ala carboxypeptidase
MQITDHFSLAELTCSYEHPEYIAENLRLAMTEPYHTNLVTLATSVLEPLRQAWSKSLHVNSGLRCVALNNVIHGSTTSQHRLGQAADLDSDDNYSLWMLAQDLMTQGHIKFGQVILEKGRERGGSQGWVHISTPAPHIYGEVMQFDGTHYHLVKQIQ